MYIYNSFKQQKIKRKKQIKMVGRSLREPLFRFSDKADSCYSTQPRKSGGHISIFESN